METHTEDVILISQGETARLLGVERTTIWRMCKRGELAKIHIGGRTLVTRASIEDFVRSQSKNR